LIRDRSSPFTAVIVALSNVAPVTFAPVKSADAVTDCAGWQSIQQYAELVIDGIRIVLCH
jgi:hypothetical protein